MAIAEGKNIPARHACWLAQQAAEKAIKAVLVFLQIDFPRRHDLDALRNLVPDGWQVRVEQLSLAGLTEWAVEADTRVTGPTPPKPTPRSQFETHGKYGISFEQTSRGTDCRWKT